jgi:hypothetical protein
MVIRASTRRAACRGLGRKFSIDGHESRPEDDEAFGGAPRSTVQGLLRYGKSHFVFELRFGVEKHRLS